MFLCEQKTVNKRSAFLSMSLCKSSTTHNDPSSSERPSGQPIITSKFGSLRMTSGASLPSGMHQYFRVKGFENDSDSCLKSLRTRLVFPVEQKNKNKK